MTEVSYFHNGISTGDAVEAPYYASTTFQKVLDIFYRNDSGWVTPNYLNMLKVTPYSGTIVYVDTGACFFKGIYFDNTVKHYLELEPNTSGNPRIDRIVVRIDWVNRNTYLAVVRGSTINSVPSFPALTQDFGTTYELPLASIYLPDSFASVPAVQIYDERNFIKTSHQDQFYKTENIINNSEFIAGRMTGADGISPAYWLANGIGAGDIDIGVNQSKFDQMDRGNTINVDLLGATGGIKSGKYIHGASSTWGTFAIILQVDENSVDISLDNGVSTIATVYPTAEPMVIYYRSLWNIAAPDIKILIDSSDTTAEFRLGQITFSYGFAPAPFSIRNETILFGNPDYNFLAGLYSTGSSTLNRNIAARYAEGLNAIQIKQQLSDSGSGGAATVYGSIDDATGATTGIDSIRTELGGVPNDVARYGSGWFRTDPPASDIDFELNRGASGVSTLTWNGWFTGVIV